MWSHYLVVCAIIVFWRGVWVNGQETCGLPPAPTNGDVFRTGDLNITTETYIYICHSDFGYVRNGSSDGIRTCHSGNWNGSIPNCVFVDCGQPVAPSNGAVIVDNTWYNSNVTYTCNDLYTLYGSGISYCDENRLWNETTPICYGPNDCMPPVAPENGAVTVTGVLEGDIATYSCNDGYVLSGLYNLTCYWGSGVWSDANEYYWVYGDQGHIHTFCTFVDCGAPPLLINGTVSATNTFYGSTANYTCDQGFALSGWSTLSCYETASWYGIKPTCSIIDCGSPGPSPVNGLIITPSGTTFQQTANYSCDPGYVIVGTNTRVCQSDGLWSNAAPSCALLCPQLLAPNNGSVDVSEGGFVGTTATYYCANGFVLQGSATRPCLAGGIWGGLEPNCTNMGSFQCEAMGLSTKSSFKMETVDSGVLSEFLFLQSVGNINVVRCARMCVDRLRAACGEPLACHMIQYHDNSRSCDLYHADANGYNVTCGISNKCYVYEQYKYFIY